MLLGLGVIERWLLHREEIHAIQSPPLSLGRNPYASGALSPRVSNPEPQRRTYQCLSAAGALLAVMAFVFLIFHCRVRITSSVGSSLVKRKLASGGEGGEEDSKQENYKQACGGSEEELDTEEITFISVSHQPPAAEGSDAGGFVKGKPRKRKGHHEHGKKEAVAPKTLKLSDGEPSQAGSSGTSLMVESTSSSVYPADGQGSEQNVVQKQDSSQQSDLGQGSSQGCTSRSDEEGRSGEAESSYYPHAFARFALEEALMAEKSLSADSSASNMNESLLQDPPLLPKDKIPELVEKLDVYISEALEAHDDALLEMWLLDPEAPVPTSPRSERPRGEDEEETSQRSAVTEGKYQNEASRLGQPLTSTSLFHFAHGTALRFLLADTLWCASQVLGDSFKRDSWWGPLMAKMLAISNPWPPEKSKRMRQGRAKLELVQAVTQVLDIYRAGQRPGPDEVVQIKRMIFCAADRLTAFEQSLWDPWREADELFRKKFEEE
ncbi:hypothetical protein ACSSS7_005790 [Eimeria intestinalis]